MAKCSYAWLVVGPGPLPPCRCLWNPPSSLKILRASDMGIAMRTGMCAQACVCGHVCGHAYGHDAAVQWESPAIVHMYIDMCIDMQIDTRKPSKLQVLT